MAKLKCRRKPRQKISGYSRCPAGTKTRRNTVAERRRKSCSRGAKKDRVSGHRRKVCHG